MNDADGPSPAAVEEIAERTRYPGNLLYTAMALREAALLCDELYRAARGRGYSHGDFELAGLGNPALQAVIRKWDSSGPRADTPEGRDLLNALAAALTERGLTAEIKQEKDFTYLAVGRAGQMPDLGPTGRASIWVGLTEHGIVGKGAGWTAAVDLPQGGPGCDIVAPGNHEGVPAVADAIARFAAGAGHNPFRHGSRGTDDERTGDLAQQGEGALCRYPRRLPRRLRRRWHVAGHQRRARAWRGPAIPRNRRAAGRWRWALLAES